MSSSSGNEKFSFDALLQAVMNNPALAQAVAREFIRLKPQQQARLQQSMDASERQGISEITHELRGMALAMGATQLGQLATTLKAHADQNFMDLLPQLHQELLTEWQAVENVLQAQKL